MFVADKAAERTASQWRVMQHLENLDTVEVLGEVMGRSLTYKTREENLNIRPIKEVTTVEVARRYMIMRDSHRAKDKNAPRPPEWAAVHMKWAASL